MTVLITGVGGLVGAAAARRFAKDHKVVGVDNDMRAYFFGAEASTAWAVAELEAALGHRFTPVRADIRDRAAIKAAFQDAGITAVVHCAAQPSHDWAAGSPRTDFSVNATGTLNLLETMRQTAPDAVFVHLSTNKVYGDRPNRLPLVEGRSRLDLPTDDRYWHGVDETMPVDQCLHSLFGVSKLAADVLVQEYGRYFGLKTVCLRGGCLTGPGHSPAQQHGFLAYLMKCAVMGEPYRVIGYGGKQVRDNLHADDLAELIARIVAAPPEPGSVFNVGGGRTNALSVLEALEMCEQIAARPIERGFDAAPRVGDHKWYITDNRRLEAAFGWTPQRKVADTLREIHAVLRREHQA